ncbi:cathepsin O-like [Pseudomyrmex gracilis]|uniref:cathepsin O-like n=1 Tax=Pseudomyrmex gracilis TaxID=219809 RepID=UPI000995671D|nr:cathepsin O-like [Pseudomyrmex gracilis]
MRDEYRARECCAYRASHKNMEWRTVVIIVLVVSLCFFIIPIRVGPDKNFEDAKLFAEYVTRYNKSYKNNPVEYKQRLEHFQRSLRHIEKMNSFRSSQESAHYGLTEFSDLSENEFKERALLSDLPLRSQKHTTASYYYQHTSDSIDHTKRATMPPKIDWREKGVVGPVLSQESCGACWAFSTIGMAESMYAIKNGSFYSFSVQEMIDCMPGDYGCQGGDICSLLSWLVESKTTIVSASAYPLTLRDDACTLSKKISAKTSGIRIKDFTCDSFVNAESKLLTRLFTHGPVAAAVNAISWQNYLGGVIQYHCDSSFDSLNHAVQIVGYDLTASIPHYIVKNSWGPTFGNKGYLYIAIGKNLCGIVNQVSSLDVV